MEIAFWCGMVLGALYMLFVDFACYMNSEQGYFLSYWLRGRR